MSTPAPIPTLRGVTRAMFESEIRPRAAPVVLQGLVADWPLVRAARESPAELARAIKALDAGRVPYVVEAPPASGGRLFYRDDLSGFNFTRQPVAIGDFLDRLLGFADADVAPALYLESLPTGPYLPKFAAAHPLPLLDARVEPRIWIGNAIVTPAHYDNSRNLACVVAGRRRFTLFPPEQIDNLHVGPIDFAPAGPCISLVDFADPDHARFPRFRAAFEHARAAELGPGDAIYIPTGWWHHVVSLDVCNVLVNYWWTADSVHSRRQ